MRRALRDNAPCAILAAAGCAALAWAGLYSFAWNDYDVEARNAVELLLAGHVHAFLASAPAYGGSLIERAPFAFAAHLLGGGQLAVYRALALPALLAAVALGVWLDARLRARGASLLARAVALIVCAANPLTLIALEVGHAEELLGGCLCVAAVMLASGSAGARARPLAAGVCLGLAVANKSWALLAIGPVLLALPPRQVLRCLAACALTAGAVLAPLLSVSSAFVSSTRALGTARSPIFEPWQVWWFLGHHGALVRGLSGPKPGYRVGPAWIEAHSHALVLAAGALLSVALWLRARRRAGTAAGPGLQTLRSGELARRTPGAAEARRLPTAASSPALDERGALLALALVLLLRCVLDTWDFAYYPLPFLLALLAYEVAARPRPQPLLALAATLLAWVSFEWLPPRVSPDAQAAFFCAWTVPLAIWLLARLLMPARTPGEPRRRAELVRGAHTTVSSFGRPVSTS